MLVIKELMVIDDTPRQYQLTVPRTRTNYGDRSFAVHGPVVWNSLHSSSRSPSAEHFTASVQETTENVPVLG